MRQRKRRTGVLKSWIKGGEKAPLSKLQKKKIPFDKLRRGWVIANSGRYWVVEEQSTAAESSSKLYLCIPARSITTDNSPNTSLLAVGDRVWFQPGILYGETVHDEQAVGVIYYIEKRQTALTRAKRGQFEQVIAANVEQLCIMVAADKPRYNRRLIDRYLVAAFKGSLSPCLIVNKIDLVDNLSEIQQDLAVYSEQLEIPVFFISIYANLHIEQITRQLQGTISVLSGPSGVGKSTLVNRLIGDAVQVTAEVGKRGKGMHTTTASRMFRLPGGGYIVDTPGIREFGIWQVRKAELRLYFPEFLHYHCRYPDCTHIHEPECGVRQAVLEGEIDPKRYESYQHLYFSLPD